MIVSAEEFVALATSEDASDRRRAAWDEAPTAVWRFLAENEPDMRLAIAFNRTVPPEILRVLITDSDWRVRSRVASKNKCPADILTVLSGDDHEAILSTVAGHPNTPTEALVRLAGHSWDEVSGKAQRQLAEREAS